MSATPGKQQRCKGDELGDPLSVSDEERCLHPLTSLISFPLPRMNKWSRVMGQREILPGMRLFTPTPKQCVPGQDQQRSPHNEHTGPTGQYKLPPPSHTRWPNPGRLLYFLRWYQQRPAASNKPSRPKQYHKGSEIKLSLELQPTK